MVNLLQEHARQIDHGTRLWDLLMLELWHREFVDRAASLNSNDAVRHRLTG